MSVEIPNKQQMTDEVDHARIRLKGASEELIGVLRQLVQKSYSIVSKGEESLELTFHVEKGWIWRDRQSTAYSEYPLSSLQAVETYAFLLSGISLVEEEFMEKEERGQTYVDWQRVQSPYFEQLVARLQDIRQILEETLTR